jgi:hypothetical protein
LVMLNRPNDNNDTAIATALNKRNADCASAAVVR